ncbi:MAG: pseudouridylate synthase [Bacteroidia bacterium]|nr:pseudouridylate synthase [Bacteroidia bacterium]
MERKQSKQLEILYEDEFLVAINKPHGLLVHKSNIAKDAQEFALQIARNQIGQRLYPVHRLDRKTSGILLFAKDKSTNSLMQQAFSKRLVQKQYLAIVRGYTNNKESIDYPLKNFKGMMQPSLTNFTTLNRTEISKSSGTFATSRYSLIKIHPITGRMHQIRKHMAHIMHPIIGDRPHGCNKQNRFFKETFNMTTMLLHASNLSFEHPRDKSVTQISARIHSEFQRMLFELGFDSSSLGSDSENTQT